MNTPAWRSVPCPTCGADTGTVCTSARSYFGSVRVKPHVARIDLGKQAEARRGRNLNGRRKTHEHARSQ